MDLIAGFDVGGTHARLAIFDTSFQVIHREKRSVRKVGSPQDMAKILAEMLSGHQPSAVGVGLAAQLDRGGENVVNAPNLDWRAVPFANMLRQEIEAPVRVVNDLNAVAWGEVVAGAAQGYDNVLAVYVGTGVGGAIVLDGVLQEGTGGVAGEIGHCKVDVGGRLCGCGERGCVEAYAGGIHLERRVREIAEIASQAGVVVLDGERIDLGAADAGVETVEEIQRIWDDAADYLALTIANACTLLNPGLLLLGGGVLDNLPSFRQMTLARIPGVVLGASRQNLDIKFGGLGEDAGMLGAAQLAQSIGSVPMHKEHA